MNKVEEIFKAWKIAYSPDNNQADLAASRIEICNSCEHKRTKLGINQCGVCGCALKGKVFSPVQGACPEGKWDTIDKKMLQSKDKIFVQLASYRDHQLVPTMRNMLEQADNPENLVFGICWQKADAETLEEFQDHPQVRYQTYHYSESEGLGWARAKVADLHEDEPFTLQIDSHHRFAPHWDTMMVEDYRQALQHSPKPIITTYLTPFETPDFEKTGYETLNKMPCLMSQYEFSDDRLLMSMPWYIQNYEQMSHVIRARTLSGHFIFTRSEFLKEVPYDPDIYFGGYCEETTMSVRAWTNGYDFWSPYRQYIWHEYTRTGRPKHWDDHGKESKTAKTSGERDQYGRNKTRQLFEQQDYGIEIEPIMGLGSQRTLHEYEEFTGFDFKGQRLQKYTLAVNSPPNPKPWAAQFELDVEVAVEVSWDREHFASQSSEPYKFITFGVIDRYNKEAYRGDFTADKHPEIVNLNVTNSTVMLTKSSMKNARFMMYGMKQDDTWTTLYEGKI